MYKDKGKDVGTRLGSILLDHAIMSGIAVLMGVPVIGLVLGILYLIHDSEFTDYIFSTAFSVMWIVIFPIYFNKDAIGGKSPAKRIIGLIIVNHKTNEVANPIRTVVRNCTLFFWPIEGFFILFSPDRRLGDFIAGTRVIEDAQGLKRNPKFKELIFSFLLALVLILPIFIVFPYVRAFYLQS